MKRSYGDGCLIAHALDLIGERWALLVVRELCDERIEDAVAAGRLKALGDCDLVERPLTPALS